MAKFKKVAKPKTKKSQKKKLKHDIQASSESVLHEVPEQSFDFNSLRAFSYCISEKFSAKRNFFLKRDPSDLDCITVTNVPSYFSLDVIKRLFTKYLTGENSVKDVILQRSASLSGNSKEGYRTLSVRLDDGDCVETALRRCEEVPLVRLSDDGIEPLPCGPKKFAKDYCDEYVPIDELQKRVDDFMSAHDNKLLEEKRNAKKMKNIPDDEGWITVTRKSNKRQPPPAVVVKSKTGSEKWLKKKKKPKEDIAFYSFQLKESKLKRLEELRAKFEEDKRKIALAKAMRKFRPQ